MFIAGALLVHKWIWFTSYMTQLHEASMPALVLPMVCLWLIPQLVIVTLRPESELDSAHESLKLVEIVPSHPRSPKKQASTDSGTASIWSLTGRAPRVSIDPESLLETIC